jgi:hypothetical protein
LERRKKELTIVFSQRIQIEFLFWREDFPIVFFQKKEKGIINSFVSKNTNRISFWKEEKRKRKGGRHKMLHRK